MKNTKIIQNVINKIINNNNNSFKQWMVRIKIYLLKNKLVIKMTNKY